MFPVLARWCLADHCAQSTVLWFVVLLMITTKSKTEPPHVGDGTPWFFVWRLISFISPPGMFAWEVSRSYTEVLVLQMGGMDTEWYIPPFSRPTPVR